MVRKQNPLVTPSIRTLLENAVAAHQRGSFTEAESGYRQVLTCQPQNADALHLLGVLRQQTGHTSDAEDLIRQAIALQENPVFISNLGNLLRTTGRSSEAEIAYRRALELSPSIADAHHGLGILLKAAERHLEAETAFRCALKLQPKNIDARINLGILLKVTGRMPEAEAEYRRAIEINPDFALTFFNLGILLSQQRRFPEAEAMYRRALSILPNDRDTHVNLGALLQQQGRADEAEASYRLALALDPACADAQVNLGNLYWDAGRFAEAEAAYRDAIVSKPESSEARLNLGLLLLALGRYAEAWPLHEARYEGSAEKSGYDIAALACPRWQGESLEGKSLVVLLEQGFGDAIQFARFAPVLKEKGVTRLTLVQRPALKPLLEALAHVDAVVTDVVQLPESDYWCFSMSLPLHLGMRLETIPAQIPYMNTVSERVATWRSRLPSGALRIGLVWKGNPKHLNNANRSLPNLALLAPLWSVPGVCFINLQKDSGEDEVDGPSARQPIVALGAHIRDFADTAAIVSQLDLIICVDTAIAHLAGALGKPTWILLPAVRTDWRWLLDREDSPWYPGVIRLFRKQRSEEWSATVERVKTALERWAADQTCPE